MTWFEDLYYTLGIDGILCLVFIVMIVCLRMGFLIIDIVSSSPTSNSHKAYETALNKYQESHSPIEETSHEGHSPYGVYSRNHEDRIGRMLVKHPEPTPGYVVLNGVKISLKNCKDL